MGLSEQNGLIMAHKQHYPINRIMGSPLFMGLSEQNGLIMLFMATLAKAATVSAGTGAPAEADAHAHGGRQLIGRGAAQL